MTTTDTIYAKQLEKSREIDIGSNEHLAIWIGDGCHRGSNVWWDDRNDRWWVAGLDNSNLTYHDHVALVRCNDDADYGLNQVQLASDLDGEGVWLVDVESLDEFEADYVDVLWRSDS